ncbi:non-specific lipid transfer protein GPI-anchored 1-like [Aristolochia californica]|uniref:non-specific lipid transfer protein GPI-anchored 1-like n=1 Tax=Aristolochia californica TaxID=171875 RepID=UPI0035DF7C4C
MVLFRSLFLLGLFVFLSLLGFSSSASSSIQDQCADEMGKVTTCLQYASGKMAAPSGDCCTAVKDIRSKAPVCLCFVIQQVNDGSPTVKDLGLKVDKLLQMPADCKLPNASATDCPGLLGLSPTSPDYALFMGSNSTTNKASPAGSGSSTSSPATQTLPSNGYAIKPQLAVAISVPLAVAFFVSKTPIMRLWTSW